MRLIPRFLVLLWSTTLLIAPANGSERILDFVSHIDVHENGDMTVREVIAVDARGQKIRRGIYRDFPTTYEDNLGNRYKVGFSILSVRRDGQPEDFHTRTLGNGIRIYFGNKNQLLDPGRHEYEFSYRTNRQLGFFEDHDELYWNVTGTGWDFAIDQASAEIALPTTVRADAIAIEGYTGPRGSQGQDYQAGVDPGGIARIQTTRTLAPNEGLTVVVSFPKGHVREPGTRDKLGHLLGDNRELLYLAFGVLVLLGYYLVVWHRVGRDQPQGIIIPLYYPPAGYSPASMRFVRNRGYDHKTFATALVNLAVKGIVRLDEEGERFVVHRTANPPGVELAAGEKVLLGKLLGSASSLVLEKSNHSRISRSIDAHKQSLKRDYEKIYFVRNRGWIVPGVIMTFAFVLAAVFNANIEAAPPALFLTIWLSIWSAIVYYLFIRAFRFWRSRSLGAAVGATLFAGVFGFFELFAMAAFTELASISLLTGILVLVGVNVVFYHLLHADTRAGRRLMDQAEGFRQYLNVAEGEDLKLAGGPGKTTDLFEMYLPFALALDVEQRWAERFAGIFATLEQQGHPYRPHWYRGSHWHAHNPARFTDTLGSSLSSAISSSSTAPGSSSGSGGGGFSGGGGGGGGGGGW